MTHSLYRGTGGHNYIQDEDNEDSFVKFEQGKARKALMIYRGITSTDDELRVNPFTTAEEIDTLTAQIIRNTCEYLGEEIQDKVPVTADGKIDRDKVEDIINNITLQ